MNYKKLRQEYYVLLEQMNINLMQQVQHLTGQEQPIKERKGVVYVINQVGTTHYKIGISTNYDERLKLFTVKLPFDIEETAVYETEQYAEKERELHTLFADKRLNGSEFFDLTLDDLALIPQIIYKNNVQEEVELETTGDDLLEQAKEIVRTEGKASTSMLQRRLRVGYSRAARIMDYLEDEGIIGKQDGAKPREILTEVSVIHNVV
jgi:DNA segregation ATPase FtsK/SpoIIIE-like protein